ncbi:MAG: response regulator [Nitrosospira sp.]
MQSNDSALSGIKILVVDDEPDVLEIITLILMHFHAEVISVAKPDEGLKQVKMHRPDVIVSDISMPHMEGYQFMRALRKLPLHDGGQTPAIAVTALTRPGDRTRAFEAGFQCHLSKPVDMHGLIATIVCAASRELHA